MALKKLELLLLKDGLYHFGLKFVHWIAIISLEKDVNCYFIKLESPLHKTLL
jgi:hypothetical protein